MVDLDKAWKNLQTTFKAILTLTGVDRSRWNGSIHDMYHLHDANPEKLYTETRVLLKDHVRKLSAKLVELNKVPSQMFRRYREEYGKGTNKIDCLYNCINTLHKGPLPEEKWKYKIREMALDMWREFILQPPEAELIRLHRNKGLTTTISFIQSFC